ncbi:BRO1-like domain-containing protein [Zychaea mexicana]|uniref:BRO1-like domain-containing protein n=1 Tax=Zychaea mexicana TaxID=64656 RepID=UPI0022FE39D2|nr:BRO1-like domain-containing protein [Zychaea mexicana]KAI9489348.1 BRO1-like domain-containing protein [Zychaea mexicana]
MNSSPVASPPSGKKTAESNMLSSSTKRTERLTWTPHLRKYISNGYAEHPDLYTDDFRVLDELRNDCIYMEASEKALNRLIKYYAQLVFIGSKFPIDVRIALWIEQQHQAYKSVLKCVWDGVGKPLDRSGISVVSSLFERRQCW